MTTEKEVLKELKKNFSYDKNTWLFIRKTWTNWAKKWKIAWSIYNTGYRFFRVLWKKYSAHRLARLYVYWKFPNNIIDHINWIRDDNRIENLRDITREENNKNMSKNRRNTSWYCGVVWDKHCNHWKVNIWKWKWKSQHYGVSKTKEWAIKLRKQAEEEFNYLPKRENDWKYYKKRRRK